MKYLVIISVVLFSGLISCDKVENPYPQIQSTELDYSLYPGTQQDYESTEWPTFIENTNSNRNILIEDFTGHKCTYCPAAGALAEGIEDANPGRVFISAIHTSEIGIGSFQTIDSEPYTHDFTCSEGVSIGTYFGQDWAGSLFVGNPRGTVSRILNGDQPTLHASQWTSFSTTALTDNVLKVNIQSEVNYYPSTNGVFLHAEIDVLDAALTNDLYIVVQFHEDSIVKPQKFPGGVDSLNYVHHDVLRGCIDGRFLGQLVDEDHKDANGRYYFNYSYELPAIYEASNTHLLIYVRDAVTEEIYQVIEQHIE